MPKLIPFVIGIAVGYVFASALTLIGILTDTEYLKIVDWAPVVNNFVDAEGNFVGLSAFFTVPKFAAIEAVKELMNGSVSAEVLAATEGNSSVITSSGIAEVIIAFLPVALVVFAEHIADHKNLSTIIEKDLIEDPGLKRTLLGDGVGSMMGTIFGVCPNTTYGESVGCVAVTGNASVVTITTTAFMCMILSFFSPLTTVLQTIPSCVMGGVCLTLYGFIAISGLKMLKNVDLNLNKNMFVIAAILIAGIGKLKVLIPYAVAESGEITKTIQITPIATALILGIATNALLNYIEKGKNKKNDNKTDN
jgi:uracil permease